MREWLIDNAETVTRVAVAIVYALGVLVAWVVLAGLVVAFRPDGGYAVEILAVSLAVTYLHVRAGKRDGKHAMGAV